VVLVAGLLDVFKKVHIRERRTFDSSRTPKAGERSRRRRRSRRSISRRCAASSRRRSRARANDPKELQKRIRRARARTGRTAAGDVEIPTRRQLHNFWLAKLDGPQGKILSELLAWYPNPLSMEELGKKVGVSHTTGSFLQNVRDLDKLGLVHRTKGRAAATELLFPRGLR
jgi:hypothetical protein